MESMRDRLERLKNSSSNEPILPIRREQRPFEERKFLTPETQFMKKVEKTMMTIETLRTKMHSGTDQYISLYQELRKAEEDFLELLKDPERKFMDLPAAFVSRVEQTKKKLLTKKL
ncbi:hypothetical protein HZA98_03775 [Candidatus Woesearchaeota archaeon]|nr:hypothetical protein [Candidatus Woesearchaeota archaeon]